MKPEVIAGKYESHRRLVPGSFRHADELLKLGLQDSQQPIELRSFTADGSGYFPREDGGIDWVITRRDNNPLLDSSPPSKASHRIDISMSTRSPMPWVSYDYFTCSDLRAQVAREAEGSVVINLDKLREHHSYDEFGFNYYFNLCTEGDGLVRVWKDLRNQYVELNEDERTLVDKVGYTPAVLAELRERGIGRVEIGFTRPNILKDIFHEQDISSLWVPSAIVPLAVVKGNKGYHFYGDGRCSYFSSSDCILQLWGTITADGLRKVLEEGGSPTLVDEEDPEKKSIVAEWRRKKVEEVEEEKRRRQRARSIKGPRSLTGDDLGFS